MNRQNSPPGSVATALMVAYALVILTPLAMVGIARPPTDHGFVYTIGKNLALVGFTILAMQFVLSARLKWIERPFGLDILFQLHKVMAMVAVTLILAHPVLVAAGGGGWHLIFGPEEISWHIWLGRIALMILLVHALLAMFRFVIKLNYQTWRFLHDLGALVVLPLAFFHSRNAGGDFKLLPMKLFWSALLATAICAFLWHRLARSIALRQHPYTVTDVRQETPDVWTIKLAPPNGSPRFDYLPGQFQFLTFHRAPNLPVEEHHWTISSTPTEEGIVASTIKESGDFTVSIGKTKPGDKALVHGPFGRFSYVLHPHERDLVFIAAGIGITPLMSMLRHMRDTRAERSVLLLYGNTGEEDIIYRDELKRMESGNQPQLKVVHVLSAPSADWQGQRGRCDAEQIERHCGADLPRRAFYICAPPALMDTAIKYLRHRGVPAKHLHFERFDL